MARYDALPPTLAPLGLGRAEAAAYLGISPGTFDKLVQDGRMPPPKLIESRKVWDRDAITIAFRELPEPERPDPRQPEGGTGWEGV